MQDNSKNAKQPIDLLIVDQMLERDGGRRCEASQENRKKSKIPIKIVVHFID
jgi:hypothetical protein